MPPTDNDFIDLFDIDAKASTLADDAFSPTFIVGSAAFTVGGQVRIIQSGSSTIIQLNTGGSLSADMTIELLNFTATNLSASDFVL